MNSDHPGSAETPTNLGTEEEATILQWAKFIIAVADEVLIEAGADMRKRRRSGIKFIEAIVDDPPKRRAAIDKAREELHWEPRWSVKEGLKETCRYFLGFLTEEIPGLERRD